MGDFRVPGLCGWVDGRALGHIFFERKNKNHGLFLVILISCGYFWYQSLFSCPIFSKKILSDN